MKRFLNFFRSGRKSPEHNRTGSRLAGITWINDRDDARISTELAAIAAHR